MKHLITTALLAAATSSAHAQLQKGSIMIGGTGGAGFGGGAGGYTATIGLQPRAGLFVTDRLAVGTGIGLGLQTFRNLAESRTTITSTSIQPFARYYFTAKPEEAGAAKRLVPFAEIGGGMAAVRAFGHTVTGGNGYGAIGFNKFFNQHVALEVSVSYNRSTDNLGRSLRGGPIGGGIGLQIFLDRGRKDAAKPRD